MDNLKKYIQDVWSNSLKTIDQATYDDIYAFSFYVYDNEDDPRRPSVMMGYNTNAQYQKEIGSSENPVEVKWNFAFWLQNDMASIGTEDDEKGNSIISEWISKKG